jgi:hypothetical protein
LPLSLYLTRASVNNFVSQEWSESWDTEPRVFARSY